nr:bifunctional glutamate N-acetyltransferase/amino-acid acetyltransferase ArgJ [Desulfobulbaceae bacterium]
MNQDLTVKGFSFSAVEAGIRGKKRLDIGLISCERPAAAAAVYTTSRVKAAPVLLGIERIKSGFAQAVMINSGIANACTGTEGMQNARKTSAMLAEALNISEDLVHVSSTGVIGQQLEMGCFSSIPQLVATRSPERVLDVAQAIMTTDTVQKLSVKEIVVDGCPVKLLGIAKGAGMIMPNMATMLGYILTDIDIAPEVLNSFLKDSAERSFNRVTIDGDTSTNDTVFLMASGLAGNARITEKSSAEALKFKTALDELCLDLALQIVADGEGATKLVAIKVVNALSTIDAELAARTIANSPLVKTAFFGQDANWGRIIAALGRSEADFDPDRVSISFDDVELVNSGLWCGAEAEKKASEVLRKDSFDVTVDLTTGSHSAVVYTSDFSLDYVKINANYRS